MSARELASKRELVVGSRGSALALTQSVAVARALERLHPGLSCRVEIIKTTGDIMREASLVAIAGKGVFTKEIEDAMLDGRVDLAVHSLKDLPTAMVEGLALAAITEREDARDAFVARPGIDSLAALPERASIGTSSPRRRAQLRAWRPDLKLVELRGNVDTRLRKIEDDNLDGVILACAGLDRLGWGERATERIDVGVMVPAVGQGALGLQTRADDVRTRRLVAGLDHRPTALACRAERAFLAAMGGGCAVPFAAYATVEEGDALAIVGAVADAEMGEIARAEVRGRVGANPERLGVELANCFAGAARGR